MPAVDGVDLTKYQGTIDEAALPAYPFLTIRATELFPTRVEHDAQYRRNRGILDRHPARWKGIYHFPCQLSAVANLDTFVNVVGAELPAGYFPKLDLEPDPPGGIPNLDAGHCLDLLNAFSDHYQRPTLAYVGHYYPASAAIRAADWPIDLPWYVSPAATRLPATITYPVAAWQWCSLPARTLGLAFMAPEHNITAQQVITPQLLDAAAALDPHPPIDPPPPEVPALPSHIGYVFSPTRGIVQVVQRFDGSPRWRFTAGEGAAFAAAGGRAPDVGDGDLDNIGQYDADDDARWLLGHSQASGGPSAGAVVDELARRLANG